MRIPKPSLHAHVYYDAIRNRKQLTYEINPGAHPWMNEQRKYDIYSQQTTYYSPMKKNEPGLSVQDSQPSHLRGRRKRMSSWSSVWDIQRECKTSLSNPVRFCLKMKNRKRPVAPQNPPGRACGTWIRDGACLESLYSLWVALPSLDTKICAQSY